MREFFKKVRLLSLLILLILLTLSSMLVGETPRRSVNENFVQRLLFDIASPVQSVIRIPIRFILKTWEDYVHLIDLKSENEVLKGRLLVQEKEILEYQEALVSSGHLQRLAKMRADFQIPLLPAKIVGQDVSPWFRSILLERGGDGLVRGGMPVVADTGLVGIITATSPTTSRAMLILDSQSSLSGIVQRSRARGLVRGTGTRLLDFVLMVRGDDVEPGDVVLTSGIDGIYPQGLKIGEISRVNYAEERLVQVAELAPAVDFGRMEQVFIMEKRGLTMDLLFEDLNGSESDKRSKKKVR